MSSITFLLLLIGIVALGALAHAIDCVAKPSWSTRVNIDCTVPGGCRGGYNKKTGFDVDLNLNDDEKQVVAKAIIRSLEAQGEEVLAKVNEEKHYVNLEELISLAKEAVFLKPAYFTYLVREGCTYWVRQLVVDCGDYRLGVDKFITYQ